SSVTGRSHRLVSTTCQLSMSWCSTGLARSSWRKKVGRPPKGFSRGPSPRLVEATRLSTARTVFPAPSGGPGGEGTAGEVDPFLLVLGSGDPDHGPDRRPVEEAVGERVIDDGKFLQSPRDRDQFLGFLVRGAGLVPDELVEGRAG